MSEKFDLMMIRKRAGLDLARLEEPAFQDLANKASDRGNSPMINMLDGQYDLLMSVLGIVMASAILFSMSKGLWFVIALSTIPALKIQLAYGRNVWGISDAQSPIRRRYYDLRNRFMGTHRLLDLQLFQNTGNFIARIEKLISSFNSENELNERKRLKSEVSAVAISLLATTGAMIVVILDVISGVTAIGTWLFIVTTMFSLQGSFSELFSCFGRQYENSLFVTDIRKVLATEPVITKPSNGFKVCSGRIPSIEFKNVTFCYPGSDKPVLSGFSLTINPGEIIALVGENGAGKTTLAKLILRVYDPTEGAVLIDGADLRTIDLDSWYAVLAILAQSNTEYYFPVDEVIALGRTDKPITRGQVIEAAKFSGADKIIGELAGQYGQQLGHEFGGVDLSAGQTQRIGLARVCYRQGLFAILDEPTAATDARAEAAIFDRLYSLRGSASVLFISHNFANVVGADRICVMVDGKVAELGSHSSLMARNGTYASLFSLQASRFAS